MSGNQLMLLGAASSVANYIEDVFSTYLYTANGSNQTITNGIDLSVKGGMLWIKDRTNGGTYPVIVDTARGSNKWIATSQTFGQQTSTSSVTSFTSSGFTLGADNGSGDTNSVNYQYTSPTNLVSWSFRKQPKFFDVVTYTGNDAAGRQIAHNLGSVPGTIIVKITSGGGNWAVYHRSVGNTKALYLNTTTTGVTASTFWNNTDPTSTHFTVGAGSAVNTNGETYVAYLFAHDAGGFGATGSDNVISCGSYTGNGSATGPSVDLGYEAQWVLIKSTTVAGSHWILLDNMRGASYTQAKELYPNLDASEISQTRSVVPTATGFQVVSTDPYLNNNGSTYIYIAIRRGPMKAPTSGTSVYLGQIRQDVNTQITTDFPVDLAIDRWEFWNDSQVARIGSFYTYDRLRGTNAILVTNTTAAEVNAGSGPAFYVSGFDSNTTIKLNTSGAQAYYGMFWLFRRAPGFFDVVCYTGTGSATTFNHNLGVAPELIIAKKRSAAGDSWAVYVASLTSSYYMLLNSSQAATLNTSRWTANAPTSTIFRVGTDGDTNDSGATYVAYLFASVTGVSKVGSYTGTGALQTVNCGFTSGARFVLIKRTDSTGDWWLYDSARGISSSDDPYLFMNSTAAQIANTNYVDTDTTGFKVTAAAPAGLNANGGTYIFLAIA